MVGYNRGMVFREVEPYLSDEELSEVKEQERQEAEGNIPKQDHLTQLYEAFEGISMDCMAQHVEAIGLFTAIREKEDREDILVMINSQIREGIWATEKSRKEILHDRETLAELKRISG